MAKTLERTRQIAIIRGVDPDDAVAVTQAFGDAGFDAVEVPLNSPRPLDSIRRMAECFADKLLIGAGTVLTIKDVQDVADVAPGFGLADTLVGGSGDTFAHHSDHGAASLDLGLRASLSPFTWKEAAVAGGTWSDAAAPDGVWTDADTETATWTDE